MPLLVFKMKEKPAKSASSLCKSEPRFILHTTGSGKNRMQKTNHSTITAVVSMNNMNRSMHIKVYVNGYKWTHVCFPHLSICRGIQTQCSCRLDSTMASQSADGPSCAGCESLLDSSCSWLFHSWWLSEGFRKALRFVGPLKKLNSQGWQNSCFAYLCLRFTLLKYTRIPQVLLPSAVSWTSRAASSSQPSVSAVDPSNDCPRSAVVAPSKTQRSAKKSICQCKPQQTAGQQFPKWKLNKT